MILPLSASRANMGSIRRWSKRLSGGKAGSIPKSRTGGELGLMQIRPLTAEEWAHAQRKGAAFGGNLFEPNTNLEVGSWYLAKLLRRYSGTDNPPAYALADYNAGRSNVLRWNKGRAATNSVLFLGQITFPGTQEYVRAILHRRDRYAYLRNENFPERARRPTDVPDLDLALAPALPGPWQSKSMCMIKSMTIRTIQRRSGS